MNTTLHSFHFVGVYPSRIHSLYKVTRYVIASSGKFCSTRGCIPSVPGDFLLLKPLIASFILVEERYASSQSRTCFFYYSTTFGCHAKRCCFRKVGLT